MCQCLTLEAIVTFQERSVCTCIHLVSITMVTHVSRYHCLVMFIENNYVTMNVFNNHGNHASANGVRCHLFRVQLMESPPAAIQGFIY